MNEDELKRKVDEFRAKTSKSEREIKDIYGKIKADQMEIKKSKLERDKCNAEVKRLMEEAKKLRNERDRLNDEVAQLKRKHKDVVTKTKKQAEEIKKFKKERDQLNKQAKTTDRVLEKRFNKMMEKLKTQDIPLEEEIKLFDDVLKTGVDLDVAKKATKIHNQILSEYISIKDMRNQLDQVSGEIDSKKKFADECHLKVKDAFEQAEKLRTLADKHHEKVTEEFEKIRPMKERIDALKAEISIIHDDMKPYSDKLEEIRREREDKKRIASAEKIKEKLMGNKRISLDDFRIMLEHGGLKQEAKTD